MILDTSALVGVIVKDPEEAQLVAHMNGATTLAAGSPTLVETGMVLTGKLGVEGTPRLTSLLQERAVVIIPFTSDHWTVALNAFLRYGKGRHPARLNFGDCMTYAVAKLSGEPLLCLGDEFAQTDLELVS